MFRHLKKRHSISIKKSPPSPTSIFKSMCVQSQLLCTKTTDSAFPFLSHTRLLSRCVNTNNSKGGNGGNSTLLVAILYFFTRFKTMRLNCLDSKTCICCAYLVSPHTHHPISHECRIFSVDDIVHQKAHTFVLALEYVLS